MDRPARKMRRSWLAAVPFALVTAMVLPTGGHAGPEPPSGVSAHTGTLFGEARANGSVVTLITGDRVHLGHVDGERTAVRVDAAPRPDGRSPSFSATAHGDDLYVVPADMQTLIPDRLDRELFNVTYLADHGYAAGAETQLPLILAAAEGQPRTFADEPIPGTEVTRELESVGATAVTADASEDSEFSAAVIDMARAADDARGDDQPLAADAGPLSGIDKIWLDAKVEAYLEHSTGQVGAPAAWEAGFDGSGATVAVLDTGIDADHPDLTGQVVQVRDFTDDGETGDPHGHGTHVASIVAGTGAASDGERQGTAPGASLLDGRVLDAEGGGLLSWIIDGMEWAAEEGADVINMSLGLPPGFLDAPVLTSAVEAVSAEHGTLIVAAAGNGYCEACIGSPADAPSTLAVGAVDRNDELAEFSSRGPVYRDVGLKPDITAPGVQISAAQAAGTGETDAPYVGMSGTSMAAPHVAGAAAIIAQAYPDLDGEGLKALLMSTARPTDGLGVYEQGSGRLDVAAALASDIHPGRGSLDFGLVPFPEPGAEPLQEALTYRNVSDQPLTLELSSDIDGPVTVEPHSLTIAPGETGSADVIVTLENADPGEYLGSITAESPSGVHLRTPVGVTIEEEHFEFTITAIARDGRPTRPWANVVSSPIIDVETGQPMFDDCPDKPFEPMEPCTRVPRGTYSVMAFVFTKPGWAPSDGDPFTETPLHAALLGDPELHIDSDMTLTLDARDAVEVEVDTPAHDAVANDAGALELSWTRAPADGPSTTDYQFNLPGTLLEQRLFMQPTDDVTVGEFTAVSRWYLTEPAITMAVDGDGGVDLRPYYYRPDWFSDQTWQFPMLDGEATMRLADAGEGTAADVEGVDLDGALALIRRSDDLPVGEQSNNAAAAGAAMVAIYNDEPGVNDDAGVLGIPLDVPTVRLSHEEGLGLLELLSSGGVTINAQGTVVSPYAYDLAYGEHGGIPENLHYVADADDMVTIERDFYAQFEGMTLGEVSYPWQPGASFSVGYMRPTGTAPDTRIVYHNNDPDLAWMHAGLTPEPRYNNIHNENPPVSPVAFESPWRQYQPGEHSRQEFFRQPVAPAFHTEFPVTRQGDILHIPTTGVVDAVGNFAETPTDLSTNGFESHFRLWLGDEVIAEATGLPAGTIELPPAEETYRVTYDVDNTASWAAMSTETSTEWTFRSAQTQEETVAALMTLRYDADIDPVNHLLDPRDRRGPNLLEITAGHQVGVDIPIRDLSVEVSYDDGETWKSRKAQRRAEGVYTVNLGAGSPGGTEYVSLRVTAEDVEGNSIQQEIIRALGVR